MGEDEEPPKIFLFGTPMEPLRPDRNYQVKTFDSAFSSWKHLENKGISFFLLWGSIEISRNLSRISTKFEKNLKNKILSKIQKKNLEKREK